MDRCRWVSYTLVHRDARLSDADMQALCNWTRVGRHAASLEPSVRDTPLPLSGPQLPEGAAASERRRLV